MSNGVPCPFGMQIQSRSYTAPDKGYRFGFNGQEADSLLLSYGNCLSFTYRTYSANLGRFFSTDPLGDQFPWNSSYAFAENQVIAYRELEGLEKYYSADGSQYYGQVGEDKSVRLVNDAYASNALNAFSTPKKDESVQTSEQRRLDLVGLKTNSFKTYDSEESAATSFGIAYGSLSIFIDREYAALIGKANVKISNEDGSEVNKEVFVLGSVVRGSKDAAPINDSKLGGVSAIGGVHTHGAGPGWQVGYNQFSSAEGDGAWSSILGKFKWDSDFVKDRNQNLYLVAPNGTLQVLKPKHLAAGNFKGEVVNYLMPHDPRGIDSNAPQNNRPAYLTRQVEYRLPQFPDHPGIKKNVRLMIQY